MNSSQHDVYVEKIAQLSSRALEAEERAEKAERERDEALATAMYAVQAAQMLSNAKNESEADEATDTISTLDDSAGPDAMAVLRAKHWREAADWIEDRDHLEPAYDIRIRSDEIERGK